MAKEKIEDAAVRLIGPAIEGMGYELVDVRFVLESRRWCLRFFIDKPGGIGVNDCEAVSREVGALLDVEDFIPQAYVLEVSSPGLDRPLYKAADYKRFEGKLAKVKTKAAIEGQKVFTGRIDNADEKGFYIITGDGKEHYIEYGQVDRARLEVEF